MKKSNLLHWILTLLMLSCSLCLLAQTKTITGKVTGPDGDPLKNASVMIKGQNKGTTTDEGGKYSIEAGNGQVLVFSYTGYAIREMTVGTRSALDVQLLQMATDLNDVVVIGYGTAKRKEVSGAVVSINPKTAGANTAINVASLIIGKAPGVQVLQGSGSPGSTPQIIIRGTGSFTRVDPLYVIDGIQSTKDMFGAIPPQDIEDITILKDAGSTAIYGSNGANGVVVVTTKKGKSGVPRATVNAQYGVANVWKKIDMMNASQYYDLLVDWTKVDKSGVLPTRFRGTGADTLKTDNTVWSDMIFHSASTYDLNASVSGGSEKSTWYFYTGYVDQEAITGTSRLKRWTNRIALTQTLGRFSFGENLLIRNDWGSGGTVALRDYLYMPNYQKVYDPSVIGGYSILTNGGDYSGVGNPIAAMETRPARSKGFVMLPQLYAEVKLIPGLKFRSQFNAQVGNNKSEYYQKGYRSGNNIDINREGGASVSEGSKYTIENYFSYNKSFNNIHNLAVTAGNTYINEGRGTSEVVKGSGYLHDSIQNVYVAPNKTIDASTYPVGSALISYFGRVSYNFNDRYFFTASFRRDGASNLDPTRNWATFPAAQFSWRFSQERFLQKFSALSDGRVRASWGRTGNNSISQNASIIAVWNGANPTGSLSYPFGLTEDHANGPAATIRSSVAPLVWETTDQTNIGLDLGFLNNKLTMSFDWYKKNSKKLLTTVLFPNSGWTGNREQASMVYNAGDVLNTGIEGIVSYHGNAGKLGYNISVNGSYNKNKVERIRISDELADQVIAAGLYWPTEYAPLKNTTLSRVGEPIASFYGFEVDGIISSKAELTALNAKAPGGVYYDANTKPGDFKFRDVNGDGKISDSDRVMLGNPIPKFMYGFNLALNYGGFDLNMVWSGVSGVKLFRSSKIFLSALQSSMHNASIDLLDRWVNDGDVTNNPRPGQNAGLNLVPSAWFVENGDYLRLRNLTIGYTLPVERTKSFFRNTLQSLRVFAAAQNLLTITKYNGYDPEVTNPDGNAADILNRGIDAGVSMPQPRTFIFGLQVGL